MLFCGTRPGGPSEDDILKWVSKRTYGCWEFGSVVVVFIRPCGCGGRSCLGLGLGLGLGGLGLGLGLVSTVVFARS